MLFVCVLEGLIKPLLCAQPEAAALLAGGCRPSGGSPAMAGGLEDRGVLCAACTPGAGL